MIKWIMRKQAEEAGKGTQLEAAKCSLERWEQGANCKDYNEFVDAVRNDNAVFSGSVSAGRCSLCSYVNHNEKATCLRSDSKPCGGICCNEYPEASFAFDNFKNDLSRQNCDLFQAKAKALCGVIKKFMDGLEPKKKELRHGDFRAIKNTNTYQLFLKDDKGVMKLFQETGGFKGPAVDWSLYEESDGKVISGNIEDIFKTLARNAEDLREFRIEAGYAGGAGFKVGISSLDCIKIGNIGNTWSYKINEAQEIHQKLGQIIATALRDERKKK